MQPADKVLLTFERWSSYSKVWVRKDRYCSDLAAVLLAKDSGGGLVHWMETPLDMVQPEWTGL